MNIFGIFHGLLVTQPQVRNLKGVQARREGRDRDKEGRSEFGPHEIVVEVDSGLGGGVRFWHRQARFFSPTTMISHISKTRRRHGSLGSKMGGPERVHCPEEGFRIKIF